MRSECDNQSIFTIDYALGGQIASIYTIESALPRFSFALGGHDPSIITIESALGGNNQSIITIEKHFLTPSRLPNAESSDFAIILCILRVVVNYDDAIVVYVQS